jgi:hypothetical protein
MSILTANLKHLYQRRGLWLIYIFMGLITLPTIVMKYKSKNIDSNDMSLLFMIYIIFFAGFMFASTQIELLSKPLTYCLPGHKKIARWFLLLVGIAISLLYSLLIFLYQDRDFGQLTIMALSAFFALLTLYCLSIWNSFLSVRGNVFLAFLPMILFVGAYFKFGNVLWNMLINYPVIFVISGILSCILVWKQLGDDGLARRYCTKPIIGFSGAWDKEKMQRLAQARFAEKGDKIYRAAPLVEQFFLGRMMKYKVLSSGRYIWGSLYKTLGPALSRGRTILYQVIPFVFLMCIFGYIDGFATSSSSASFMLFIMPCIMAVFIQLPFYSNMLIAGGRKERFYSTMAVIVAVILIVTAVFVTLTALAQPLEKVLPEITLHGRQLSFKVPYMKLFFVPLLIMPIFFILNILIRRKFILFIMTIMFCSMAFSILALPRGYNTPSPAQDWLTTLNPVYMVVAIVLVWLIMAAAVRYVCMKRPLAGQGRG